MPVSLARTSILALVVIAGVAAPAFAGYDEGVKAIQANDMVKAEKELELLSKERDPRAQFLMGLYVYGNAESKLFDLNKATPLLLDAAERGYTPAMIPLAGAYAEGKGVPKSLFEAYKWVAIAERWNVPQATMLLEHAARDLKPDEIEKATAAAQAFVFKTK